jgi:hypothetical protein
MVSYLLAAAMATAVPSPCPADLLVANPRLKIVRATDKAYDNYVVTVDVKNRGVAAQPADTAQHLELVRGGKPIGSQPVPALGQGQAYVAAFRVQLPHDAKRAPFTVEFRYVLDSKNAPRANCTSANDRLSATL